MRHAGRCQATGLAALILLLASGPARAQDDFGKQVNAAIDRGVTALRRSQVGAAAPNPAQGHIATAQHIGSTALVGLTLLECGVKPNEPVVKKTADTVRQGSVNLKYVYAVSLAILFLDRLGDPQDAPLIEALAVRLLAGQDRKQGAWSYYTPTPSADEVRRLTDVLQKRKDDQAGHTNEKRQPRTYKDLARATQQELVKTYKGTGYTATQEVDNSNTQFALLALWVARRHGLPVDWAIARVEQRLRATQRPHGGWTYRFPPFVTDPGVFRSPDYQPSPQMTCAGLLGMALAHAVNADNPRAPKRDLAKDETVTRGFLALGAVIGEPTGNAGSVPKLDRPGKVYYFLWTMERMAVVYGLKTIGGKDWYRWGAEILLAHQGGDGSWSGEYSVGGCDTCFALLFLKRSNVAPDLSERLKERTKDPGKAPPRLLEMIEKEFAPTPGRPGRKPRQGSTAPAYRPVTLVQHSALTARSPRRG